MANFTDDGEADYPELHEKRKNEERQREHEGDKRLYFDDDEKKQYYVDENGNRVYLKPKSGKRDNSIKVAIIGGIFAVIVAIIGILPLFPVETPTGGTEFVPPICVLWNTQLIHSMFNCGNQTNKIEVAVSATLTAVAITPVLPTAIVITATPEPQLTNTPEIIIVTATPMSHLTVTAQPSTTPIASPTHLVPTQLTARDCVETFVQGNIPVLTEENITVEPSEFHVWSSGDICVRYNGNNVNCVVANPDKGFISVFLPVDNQTTTYSLYQLVPRNNWHGIYTVCTNVERDDILKDRASDLARPGNCADGNGCGEIYVRIFNGDSMEQTQYTP